MDKLEKQLKALTVTVAHISARLVQSVRSLTQTIHTHKGELDQLKDKVDNLKLQKGDTGPQGKTGKTGARGPKGDRGEPGRAGRDAKDGKDGRDGVNGKDGAPGKDGKDGKASDPKEVLDMVEKRLPELGERVRDSLELLNGDNRLDKSAISGLEDLFKNVHEIRSGGGAASVLVRNGETGNATRVKGLNFTNNSLTINSDGTATVNITAGGGSGTIADSFETVSQNLSAYDHDITYDINGDIDTIVYDLGGGMTITKTFSYSAGDISYITLSGDTPAGIDLTKSFIYSGGDIAQIIYGIAATYLLQQDGTFLLLQDGDKVKLTDFA